MLTSIFHNFEYIFALLHQKSRYLIVYSSLVTSTRDKTYEKYHFIKLYEIMYIEVFGDAYFIGDINFL